MLRAPLGRSRQPMARMMESAWISNMPSVRFMAVITLSGEIFMTMVFSRYSMPISSTREMKRAAYSGPVSSSLKVWRPKPLWMH